MTSVVYPKTLEAMWGAGAGAVAGVVKAIAVDDATYTYSATHEFLSDVSGIVSDAITVGSKDFTSGVFTTTGGALALTGVSSLEHVGAIITYVDTGVAGTSRLLTYDDENDDTTGIDVDGNNQTLSLVWPSYIGRI